MSTKNHELKIKSSGANNFFQNSSYLPKSEKKASMGECFLMLEVLNANENQAKQIQKVIFDNLKKHFYENENLSSYERFEESLKIVNQEIKSLRRKEKSSIRINAVLGVLSGSELHLSQTGYSEAYLNRENTFTLISEGLYAEDESDNIFQNIASGLLEKNDKVIFSSERLLRFANPQEINKIFSIGTLEHSMNEIKDILSLEGLENINMYAIDVAEIDGENVVTEKEKGEGFLSPYLAKAQNLSRDLEEYGITRNTILATLGAIILVLILSVWILGASRTSQAENTAIAQTITAVQGKIDEASTLSMVGKKEMANEILNTEEAELNKLLENPGSYRDAIIALKNKLNDQRDFIDGVKRLSDGGVLADLSGKRNDMQARGMINMPSDAKYVYDQNALFETILSDVSDPMTISENGDIIDGKYFAEFKNQVFLDKNNGIMEYTDGMFSNVGTSDETWKPAVSIDTYYKYLYLLDPSEGEDGQIWKYQRGRNGYGSATAYSVDTPLKNAVDLSVDGSLWLLYNDGQIGKIFKGERQDITIEDAPSQAPSGAVKIFTTSEIKNLYVLDPLRNRVISYYKSESNPGLLEYVEQFVYDAELNAHDVFITANEQKLYLLTDDKIMEYTI